MYLLGSHVTRESSHVIYASSEWDYRDITDLLEDCFQEGGALELRWAESVPEELA
jgi:hypothetical protein